MFSSNAESFIHKLIIKFIHKKEVLAINNNAVVYILHIQSMINTISKIRKDVTKSKCQSLVIVEYNSFEI